MSSSSDPKGAAVPFGNMDGVVSSSHSQPFKHMSIDNTGSLVALCGGNKGVTVLELDQPDKDGFRLQEHQSRSEVGVVRCHLSLSLLLRVTQNANDKWQHTTPI